MTSAVKESAEYGVFDLLTVLCNKIAASKHNCKNRVAQTRLASQMRSHAYEILLKKTSKEIDYGKGEPIIDLLSYYMKFYKNAKNVAEYKRAVKLKNCISKIRQLDAGEEKDNFYNVLQFLILLNDSVKEDYSMELFQNPFSFGVQAEMLPKLPREKFGSPQPYAYFPSYVFELPYSLRQKTSFMSPTYTEYTVKSFDSKPLISEHTWKNPDEHQISPISMASLSISSHQSPYSGSTSWNYPRMTSPRDLKLPTDNDNLSTKDNIKITFASTVDMKAVYIAGTDEESVDIWELASQMDKDIPSDIWEVVSTMHPIKERQLIATSSREIMLWRKLYGDELGTLYVVSERQFIRHIMYLLIGIETSSFPFNAEKNCFLMREGLVLEGVSKERIKGYISELLLVGTYYKRLFKFAFNQTLEDHFHSFGLIYEAAREAIRRYLLEFRQLATNIYEDCSKPNRQAECLPTLLQILHHTEPLRYEIETVVTIYNLDQDGTRRLPHGVELMSYLFNEISLVTHASTALTLYNALFSVCKVYFKFIERFIFEGRLDDRFNEFFIRKDSQYVKIRSKRYWDKGFHIIQGLAVPEFLKSLAKYILLCGKSLRLLKHCNPTDPLIIVISSDHPSVKCCASFEELERQEQILDVYRTRCLFVSGEPVTFEQILLKREAERKAFAEMASVKQAETMEKIVAERKRLAQLIIAEKQHSLRVLEAAMAEAKAAKLKAKKRERGITELERAADRAAEEVDSKIRDDERNKMLQYYSKLNMEVEKSKIHTEWKIKRLQLDQSRIQLLSTEERNLKREKLEMELKKNEEIMAMSIQSDADVLDDKDNDESPEKVEKSETTEALEAEHVVAEPKVETNKGRSKTDVLSAICNAAKSLFGVSSNEVNCDNNKKVDDEGNVVAVDTDNNLESKTSSDVIGKNLQDYDNVEYLTSREDALKNRKKVMAHVFGQKDMENNELHLAKADGDNNFDMFSAFAEARRNKLKVLNAEFGTNETNPKTIPGKPRTDAQKQALLNKQKVLGVEYNLPVILETPNEPANVAQEEAVRNRNKILGSDDVKPLEVAVKRETAKRSGLTLNLTPYGEIATNVNVASDTPLTGVVTPGDMFPGLDLETPTTAEVPLTSEVFTPQCETAQMETEKPFLTCDGFNFQIIDEEEAESGLESAQSSPAKKNPENKRPFINMIDGTYSLREFDPFGVKDLKEFSKDFFSKKMNSQGYESCYTHPAIIMDEVKKAPYSNIFASHFGTQDEDENKVNCDNIATLTACLQRSVMLPLTYQLEVVNNSILTYFLVNLDMYEHLRSLKDYFFLMDGEFSRSICQNLFTRLVKTLNPEDLLNFGTLHGILDKALESSISHVHKFSENLSFAMTECPLSFQHSSPDVLQCLSLTYSVSWPLNIILSNEALQRYAKVFQFLIKMRRIFWVLSENFQSLKISVKLTKEHSRKLLKSPQYISLQIYRHNMASMVRALDNYIVTTCILTSWNEFENDLKKARTLDDLYECHVVYIKKVLFRCLLNNRSTPVMKLFNDIFTVILKFSRLLMAGEWQQLETNDYFTHSSFLQLKELYNLFEKLAKYLQKVITKLMECGYQRHLVELLSMINLNGYYLYSNEKKEDTTSSPQSS